MTRAEIIALVVAKADQHDLIPVEFLGGIIAEGLDVHASRPTSQEDWRHYWAIQDMSFGLGQKNARFSAEYAAWCAQRGIPFQLGGPADAYPGDEVIAMIRDAYFDPAHALDVAAVEYRKWRYDPEVEPLHAWSAYNGPAYYRGWTRDNGTVVTWRDNPNLSNYAAGLAEAARILGATPMPVTFDPNYPAVIQNDNWSCAPTSLTWAMRALGRNPETDWIETDMVALNLVSKELGLLDHTGGGIVHWLQINDAQHYGSDGYGISNAQCPIGWDQLVPEINPHPPYPLLLGLPNWGGPSKGHWSGVRGYDAGRGVILLANPDNGPTYGVTELTRQQFEAKAGNNASIVRVLHPDLIGVPSPPPPPPVPPKAPTRAEFDALTAKINDLLAAFRAKITA